MEVRSRQCHDKVSAMCEFDCMMPFPCPIDHPFALADGTKCCKYYNKINNSNVNEDCDGTDFEMTDIDDCCLDVVDCPYGECVDHPAGKGRVCVSVDTDK